MKTVALVDFQTAGHHFAFIRLFAKYLIRNNYRVCIMYPEKGSEIRKYLLDQGASSSAVICCEVSVSKKKIAGFGRFNEAIATAKYWFDTKQILHKTSRLHNLKFDFVFFAWLDDHLANYLSHKIVDSFFHYRWSGLYFHPWFLYGTHPTRVSFSSIDSVLRSINCLFVAIHDEFVLNKLQLRFKKPVLLFPEMADSTAPDARYAIAQEINSRARGRMKIGLIGCDKRKGVLPFIDLAKKANPENLFFFLAGPPELSKFNELEQEKFTEFVKSSKENFFYHPNYIPEGDKINAVINALDVIYMVYEDFRSSSNFSTKAVLFKKRVLATELYWIGSVTKKYNLGVTVSEGYDMLTALDRLCYEITNGINVPLFQAYLDMHQEQNLEKLFAQCFPRDQSN